MGQPTAQITARLEGSRDSASNSLRRTRSHPQGVMEVHLAGAAGIGPSMAGESAQTPGGHVWPRLA